MDPQSETRVALVTGGGRGIGRGIALALAEQGYALVVNYREDAAAAACTCRDAEALGAPAAHAIRADVADLGQGRLLVEESLRVLGRIDLLVNNAGVAPEQRLDVLDTTPESWDRVISTNLRGPFFLTQAVARAMLALLSQGNVKQPQIVFITSVSSAMASVSRSEYCVSKTGLSMVAQLFALRLAGAGIRVYEVRPGLIETEMTAPVKALYDAKIAGGVVPLGRWGTPEDVGRAVAAIAAGAFPYTTGSIMHVDGGLALPAL
jgi:NAD(P)-dependent dehydrogenase (short-subunit alcohol dehydrogenase family)